MLPLHRLAVPEPGLLPFAIGSFDAVGPQSRANYPHRHTFYEIQFVTGGSGMHVIDLAEWPLHPPHLCVVIPGQVHYWESTTELQGLVLLFTEDFLVVHPEDRDLLHDLGERPWMYLDSVTVQRIEPLMTALLREYEDQSEGFISVLQSYLHILVLQASRLQLSRPRGAPANSDLASGPTDIARQFADLLARTGARHWTVRSLASELGLSVGHLSDAVKSATGRTPGELIRQNRVLEAKRLLAGTTSTIGQIAREVGFSDPAYFCRFFRRETGVSPGEFRRSRLANHHDRRALSIDRPGSHP